MGQTVGENYVHKDQENVMDNTSGVAEVRQAGRETRTFQAEKWMKKPEKCPVHRAPYTNSSDWNSVYMPMSTSKEETTPCLCLKTVRCFPIFVSLDPYRKKEKKLIITPILIMRELRLRNQVTCSRHTATKVGFEDLLSYLVFPTLTTWWW